MKRRVTVILSVLAALYVTYKLVAKRCYEETTVQRYEVDSKQGFVLTLLYTGQFVAGLRGVASLQCWLGSFGLPMVLVEPHVVDSILKQDVDEWRRQIASYERMGTRLRRQAAGMEAVDNISVETLPDDKTRALAVSDFFNIRIVNEMSEKVPLVRLDKLWHQAPKLLIVLSMNAYFNKNCIRYTKAEMCRAKREASYEDKELSTSGCPQHEDVIKSVDFLVSRGFKVVRSVCLNCDHNPLMYFTPSELTKYIFGEFSPSEVTLVISHWKYTYNLTPGCVHCAAGDENILTKLTPSPHLVEQADAYLKPLKDEPHTKVIAIMIRIEWFLIMHKQRRIEGFESCLLEILDEYSQLLSTHPVTKTVLAMDIGKYGSGTFSTTLRIQNISSDLFLVVVEEMKRFVKKVNLDYDDWEESFASVVGSGTSEDDRGYVAILQSVIVSKADYIIRMGGGHYQLLALNLYTKNHPKDMQTIIDVCTSKKFVL